MYLTSLPDWGLGGAVSHPLITVGFVLWYLAPLSTCQSVPEQDTEP